MKNLLNMHRQHQCELISLLAVVYLHPKKAMQALETRIGRYGFEPAVRMSRENPRRLGKLRGSYPLKIYKDATRRDAEWAMQSIRYPAQRWYLSLLQLQQAKRDLESRASKKTSRPRNHLLAQVARRSVVRDELER